MFGFKLEPISVNDQAAQKNVAHMKSSQKWHKNNHVDDFNKGLFKSHIHCI